MPPPSSYSLIPAISAQENGFISIVLKKGLEKKKLKREWSLVLWSIEL